MKILVVEDDQSVARSIEMLLSSFNYAVDIAADGEVGLQMSEAFTYDLALLDVGLPKLDGVSLCRQLRSRGLQHPILLLTGQREGRQKAIALNAGADDYVVKPFDAEELIARVQALLRRGGTTAQPILTWGDLYIDPSKRHVTYKTHLLPVTLKEYAILELLLRHPQKVFSAAAILDHVWDSADAPGEEAVRVHIKEIRQKLKAADAPKDLIKTVYQSGYRLNPLYSSTLAEQVEHQPSLPQIAELTTVNQELRNLVERLQSTQADLQQKQLALETAYQASEQERQCLQTAYNALQFQIAEHKDANPAITTSLPPSDLVPSDLAPSAPSPLTHLPDWTAATPISPDSLTDLKLREITHALSHAVEGISRLDSQGRYLFVNAAYASMVGYTPEEMIGMNWQTTVHPDDLAAVVDAYQQMLSQGRVELEARGVRKDGSVFDKQLFMVTASDQQQQLGGHYCFMKDISQRKQAETALQLSQERLQLALEGSGDGLWDWNIVTGEVYFSPSWLEMLGYGVGELPSHVSTWHNLIHPEDQVQVMERLNAHLKDSACPYSFEYRVQTKSGTWKWIGNYGKVVVRDAQGNPLRMAGLHKDIDDRKRAEAALKRQLKREHLIAELTQSIRQTLDLNQILQHTVDQVRQVLQTDRVIILRFRTDWQGLVVAESVAPGWLSILDHKIHDPCFTEHYIEPYRQGRVSMIADVARYGITPCHAEFLASFQVKANLVIPILQKHQEQDRLWGLLISHHCASPRLWHIEEVDLLKQLANQLGIAIQQSELHEQTCRELRERQRAEAELRISEARYRLLFESNPNPIWVFDVNTLEFLAVNQAAIKHYGYSREEFLNMTVADIRPSEDMHKLQAALPSLTPNQKYFGIWKHFKKNGQLIDVEILAHTFTFEGKRASLVLVTDITERLQAEHKIREQAALLDIASDAIFVRDLEHHILYWNQGSERLYGWSSSEVMGQKATELLQDDAAKIAEIMQSLLNQGEWQGELQKVTKSGKKVIVEGRWTLVRDEANQPKYILSVNTDVTEKKWLETQFHHAQRLESLGTLASGIAHDLNNVLTPILAIAQLIRLTSPNLDTGLQEKLRILEESAQRGATMVKQILTFASGTQERPITLQIAPLLQEVVQVVESTFPASIQIRQQVPEQFLGLVFADPTHLHQVFMNLCVNARDAMPDGGTLTLSAENYQVDQHFAQRNLEAEVGDYVLVTVVDTGVGIAAEVQDHIFEPFFTTKAIGQGTGLGLSTALGIIKTYGGFMQVMSEVGQGTVVKVYLPVANGAVAERNSAPEVFHGAGELVLIVDDDLAVQQTNQLLLESYQYRTLTANNGVEAIERYGEYYDEIKVVLIDVMMPNMDGVTAVHTLRQINPRVKIIAISGLASNQDMTLAAGADVFLLKPYTLEDLLQHLELLVQAERSPI